MLRSRSSCSLLKVDQLTLYSVLFILPTRDIEVLETFAGKLQVSAHSILLEMERVNARDTWYMFSSLYATYISLLAIGVEGSCLTILLVSFPYINTFVAPYNISIAFSVLCIHRQMFD